MSPETFTSLSFPKEKKLSPDYFLTHRPSFDLDGVLINSIEYITGVFNKEHGTNFIATDMREFKIVKKWLLQMGYSKSYADCKELEYWYGDKLLESPFNSGAIEHLCKLDALGVPITVISSRPKGLRESTIELLVKNTPILRENIFIQNGSEMPGNIWKAFVVGKTGVGIHFEDNPSHSEAVLDYTEADVCLMANLIDLDFNPNYSERLFRIKGASPTEMPNFTELNKVF